jgi:hypothetical protein
MNATECGGDNDRPCSVAFFSFCTGSYDEVNMTEIFAGKKKYSHFLPYIREFFPEI